jgi:hypothetical protein
MNARWAREWWSPGRVAPCAARVLAAALWVGCGGGGAASDGGGADAAGPWVEAGTGSADFVSLADGDTIQLYAGPQGGYHTFGAMRGGGLACPGATLHFRVVDGIDLTTVLAESTYVDDLQRVGDEKRYIGVALMFAGWAGAPLTQAMADLDGRALRLELDVLDAAGASASSTVDVVGACCN